MAPRTDTLVIRTAKQLLDFLNPLNQPWGEQILYRAQFEPEAGYPLLPSLYRDPRESPELARWIGRALNKLEATSPNREHYTNFQNLYKLPWAKETLTRSATEQLILKSFVDRANALGIHVPESDIMLNWQFSTSQFLKWQNIFKLKFEKNESDDLLPFESYKYRELLDEISINRPPLFTGLAQHHGAKTRLLDFSYNAYKALFHVVNCNAAKKEANKPDGHSGVISLYAISEHIFDRAILSEFSRRNFVDSPNQDERLKTASFESSTYQVVKMPASDNHYLHQQEGLFVYPLFPYDYYYLHGKFPSLNDFVMAMYPEEQNRLKKVSISITEYHNLKTLLDKAGITLSRMFPSLDNVVKEMESDQGQY